MHIYIRFSSNTKANEVILKRMRLCIYALLNRVVCYVISKDENYYDNSSIRSVLLETGDLDDTGICS